MSMIKVGILTGLCCVSLSLQLMADQNRDDECSKRDNVCNVYKGNDQPKHAFELCQRYCLDSRCTEPSNKANKSCTSALAKFLALGIGSPVCVAPVRAYITNFFGNTVSLCSVNPDGKLSNCTDSGVNVQFDSPVGIALNKVQDTAYVTNYGNNNTLPNTVSKCAVNTTGQFTGCIDSGAGTAFTQPFGIALNKAENTAYITNNTGGTSVTKCTLSASMFTGCVDAGIGGAIGSKPVGIALNATESIAYVATDPGNNVMKCTISGGVFTACTPTGTGMNNTIGVALSTNGKFAYVTNDSKDTVSKCAISAVAGPVLGDLIDCTDSGVGAIFTFPLGITITKGGDTAYITNLNSNKITKCAIDIDTGSATYSKFTGCTDSGVGALFQGPFNIIFAY